MHSQVAQLFQQSPELRVVSHQRNDIRVPILGSYNFGVLQETGQQPSAFAPDDDPISPGIADRSDHKGSAAAIRGWS